MGLECREANSNPRDNGAAAGQEAVNAGFFLPGGSVVRVAAISASRELSVATSPEVQDDLKAADRAFVGALGETYDTASK